MAVGRRSGQYQAAGGLEHLRQPIGQLKIAQRIRRQPFEVVEFFVQDRLAADPRAVTVLIPRTERQADAARGRGERGPIVPERAIDAQSLIAYSDLVISAGGTMNREAVALGTPVYTTFEGRLGAVDEMLLGEGRMRRLSNPDEIALEKRTGSSGERIRRDPRLLVDRLLGP